MLPWLLHLDTDNPSTGYAVLGVLIGGACGALLRFLTASLLANAPSPVPLPTLLVNAVGSLAAGLTAGLLARQAGSASGWWRDVLVVGVCGGLTTFSTLCLESVLMWEAEAEAQAGSAGGGGKGGWRGWWRGGGNMLLHNALCIGLVYFGLAIASGFSTTVTPT